MNAPSRRPDHAALWNALPAPALALDAQDRVLEVNGAAEAFLGLSARSLRGRALADLFGPASRVLDLLAQLRRGAATVAEYDMELLMPERPPCRADIHAAPVAEGAGDALLLIQPQSLARKMDRSMSHRSAARTISGMAAMLAHEIKNPLAGISGAAQLLEMNLGEEERELTRLIRDEAERIVKLIGRVDRFGDSRPVERRPVNIHDVLDRARLSAQAGFASHLRLSAEYDPSLPPAAADPDQLMQVFLNLLKNAAEAAPRVGGAVAVRTSYRPGLRLSLPSGRRESLPLEVAVIDNGPGVPESIRADIFEPFVTTKSAGAGLGLALVAKIVADLGGAVECESEPGRTVFRVLLPIWRDSGRDEAPQEDDA